MDLPRLSKSQQNKNKQNKAKANSEGLIRKNKAKRNSERDTYFSVAAASQKSIFTSVRALGEGVLCEREKLFVVFNHPGFARMHSGGTLETNEWPTYRTRAVYKWSATVPVFLFRFFCIFRISA